MRTNSNAYRALIRAHILAGIYDYTGPDDDTARARHIWAKFCSEYNHAAERKRTPNIQHRVAEYLAGLPLNIAYSNYDIVQLYQAWHGETLSDKKADSIVANWFNHCAFHLLRIWQDAGINPHIPEVQGAIIYREGATE